MLKCGFFPLFKKTFLIKESQLLSACEWSDVNLNKKKNDMPNNDEDILRLV